MDVAGPTAEERQKYSGVGGFHESVFSNSGVPTSLAPCLAEAGNFSLAASTWKTYKTPDNHVDRCNQEMGTNLTYPFSVVDILTFIGWLVEKRGVRSTTVQVYMSAVRMGHLKRGFYNTNLRPDIVQLIITGLKQRDLLKDKLAGKVGRAPIDMKLMRIIKIGLRNSKWSVHKKRLVLAVANTSFNGSFRIHELLSRQKNCFDPTSTLLTRDVVVDETSEVGEIQGVLRVHLKSPKESRLRHGVKVEIAATGSFICPVVAVKNYVRDARFPLSSDKPFFRSQDGSGYTGAAFNLDLKSLLDGHVDYSQGKITSHSFRAGLATGHGVITFA